MMQSVTPPAYREWVPPAALARHVARIWTRQGVSDGRPATVLPDGSADLVLAGGRLMLVGTMTRAFSAVGSGAAAGVRLRPEAARLLGFPAFELTDTRIPVADGWGRAGTEIEERALEAGGPDAVAAVLAAAVADRIDRDASVDALVGAAA